MRDVTTVYKTMYCKSCGWEHEDLTGYVMVNACPNCQRHGLSFLRFTEEERPEARKILDDNIKQANRRQATEFSHKPGEWR